MTCKLGIVSSALCAMMVVAVGGCGNDSSTTSTGSTGGDTTASPANPSPPSVPTVASADAEAQKILDQAETYIRENKYDLARQSIGQLKGMSSTLSPEMGERVTGADTALATAADAQAQKILDQAMTYIKENRCDLARQSVGQLKGMTWRLSPAMAERVTSADTALTTAADAQAQKVLDQAMTCMKENKYDLARQSIGQLQGMSRTLSPAMAERVTSASGALATAADAQAQKILDQAMTYIKENNYDLARQSIGRLQGMTWTLSPAMVERVTSASGALAAATQAKAADSALTDAARAAATAAADSQAQKVLDQVVTYTKENRYDLAHQSLGQVEAMERTLSPAMVKAIDAARGALIAAADRQAQKILDQVMTYAKENRYEMAHQLLGQAEVMGWTLSPTAVKAIDAARASVTAAADSQAQKILDQVVTYTKENRYDLAHQYLGHAGSAGWTLSPTVVKAIDAARANVTATADSQAQKILDRVTTYTNENKYDLAHQFLGQAEAMGWTLSPTVVKRIDGTRTSLDTAQNGRRIEGSL